MKKIKNNMLNKTLQKFLATNKAKYEIIEHKTVYTAFDKAATLGVKPETIGKTVLVSLDKDIIFGLIPANKNLDKKKVLAAFNKLRQKNKQPKYKKIDFVAEKWMKNNIKGIDLGATPPFGALYQAPFFIDNILTRLTKIIINGGQYEISLKISPAILIKINQNVLKGGFSMAKK